MHLTRSEFMAYSRWWKVRTIARHPIFFTKVFLGETYRGLGLSRIKRKHVIGTVGIAAVFCGLAYVLPQLSDTFLTRWGNLLGAAIGVLGTGIVAVWTVNATHRKEEAAKRRDLSDERTAIALVCMSELNAWLVGFRECHRIGLIHKDLLALEESRLHLVLDRVQLFNRYVIVAVLNARKSLAALPLLPYDEQSRTIALGPTTPTAVLVNHCERNCILAYFELNRYIPNHELSLPMHWLEIPHADSKKLQPLAKAINSHWRRLEHPQRDIVHTLTFGGSPDGRVRINV